MNDDRSGLAVELMSQFADRTGIPSAGSGRRYLWTDAFAVCNFLALESATGDHRYEPLALRLVEQVHDRLGRFRDDDERKGWISGLPESEGREHPTQGGLRIGKRFPERGPTEPFDPDAEWDRDGQYFHYLTQWSHALDQLTHWTRDPKFHKWARELMNAAHRAFSQGAPGARRIVWKLSTDLSRPLVSSMGQLDPLDGLVACVELDATANELKLVAEPALAEATADLSTMLDRTRLVTADPLGLGGLLIDATRLMLSYPRNSELVGWLLAAAVMGLREYVGAADLAGPPHRRLAFRELGLAIGLAGIEAIHENASVGWLDPRERVQLAELTRYRTLRDRIESFWMVAERRRADSWLEHADINDVMLATSLVPEGYLVPASVTSE